MMSLMFLVGFLFLLLLPITSLCILISLQFHQQQQNTSSVANNNNIDKHSILHSYLLNSHMSSTCKLLIHHAIFQNYPHSTREIAPGVRRYEGSREGRDAAECRVCLCEIESGEEIRELRCNHLFHKLCLDAWIGQGSATCPICRGGVLIDRVEEVEGGDHQAILFRFGSFGSGRRGHRQDSWWLR